MIQTLIQHIFQSHFLEPHTLKKKIEVELDLSNYAMASDLKSITGVNTSQFTKKNELNNLKPEVNKFNIGKSENTFAYLSKLRNVVENVVKQANAIKTTDTSHLVKKADCNTKPEEIEKTTLGYGKYITTQESYLN